MAPAMSRKLHIDNGNEPGYTYCGHRSSPVNARPFRDYVTDPENSVWCENCVRAISAGPKPIYRVRMHPAIHRMPRRSLVLHKRFPSIAQSVRYRRLRTRRYGLRQPNAPRIVDGRFLDAAGERDKQPYPPNTKWIVDGRPLDKDRRVLTLDGKRDEEFKIPCPPNTVRIVDGHFLDASDCVLTKSGRRNKRFTGPYQPRNENWSIRRESNSGMGRRRRGGP